MNISTQLEQRVLGTVMIRPAALGRARVAFAGYVFTVHAHFLIWDAITALDSEGRGYDPVSVANRLTETQTLALAGGAPYLHTLIAVAPYGVTYEGGRRR